MAYLWIDGDKTVMETPIVYPGDKAELGERYGLFYLGFDAKITLPIDNPSPVAPEYQELFEQYIEGYGG